MKYPIRVDRTQGEILFFDADNILVTPDELAEEVNRLNERVDELRQELRDE